VRGRNSPEKISMATSKAPNDQEFLEYVVKSLVDHPDDVKTERKVDEMGVLITLSVNPEDMGQIIGRSGDTARSIRSLLRIVGSKNDARVNLKIEEPEGSTRRNAAPRREQPTNVEEAVGDLNL
jgi:uncharacterized protein